MANRLNPNKGGLRVSSDKMCGCGIECECIVDGKLKLCAPLNVSTVNFKSCPNPDLQRPVERPEIEEDVDKLRKAVDEVANKTNAEGEKAALAEGKVVYTCPVHGDAVDALTFSSPQLGGTVAYCMQCFVKQMSRILKPLETTKWTPPKKD